MTATAFVYDAVRTPRGRARPDGALADVKPVELVAVLLRELASRGVDPSVVDDVVLGCSTQVGEQGADIARTAAVWAGWDGVSGRTVNRFCASGLDAVASAAARVIAGFDHLVVAGGVESMSRVPMLSDRGALFTDPEVIERVGWVHMGVAADLVASAHGVTRADCDALAVRSHRRAAAARDAGRFPSIVPVSVDGNAVTTDEAIRDGVTTEKLAGLPPAFGSFVDDAARSVVRRHHADVALEHVHTVATSPAMVDAASAVVVGSREAGEKAGLTPRGRIVMSADHAVDPVMMLTGPATASRKALERVGMKPGDVDRWECNESFAATVLVFQRALDLDEARVNPDGGAIALGHPLGATGGILVGMLLDGLEADDGTVGVATIPGAAGVAQAVVVERI